MISITLEGGKQLERKLMALERKVGKKIVRKGVRAGLKPTLKACKANAKSMVGGKMGALLSKNLVLHGFKRQRRGSYGMSVWTRPDVKEFVHEASHSRYRGGKTYIPAAIEYGHVMAGLAMSPATRRAKQSSIFEAGRGKEVPAIPFMRTAADAELKKGVKIFGHTVKAKIEEVAKRGR